jgi:hypothetical protein
MNIGVAYKVTGRVKNEEVFVMVGENVKIHFEASPKSLDNNQSLKKWGYRARSFPLYGYDSSLTTQSDCSGSVPVKLKIFSTNLIQMLNRLTITLIKEIEPFLKGKRLNMEEKRMKKYLNWNILKNGLNSLKRDQFLQDNKNGLKLSQKMKETISKVIIDSEEGAN